MSSLGCLESWVLHRFRKKTKGGGDTNLYEGSEKALITFVQEKLKIKFKKGCQW